VRAAIERAEQEEKKAPPPPQAQTAARVERAKKCVICGKWVKSGGFVLPCNHVAHTKCMAKHYTAKSGGGSYNELKCFACATPLGTDRACWERQAHYLDTLRGKKAAAVVIPSPPAAATSTPLVSVSSALPPGVSSGFAAQARQAAAQSAVPTTPPSSSVPSVAPRTLARTELSGEESEE
jgi:hypothetical protein